MKKKKVLLHGTLENLPKFFMDAVSRDYEVVAIMSEEDFSTDLKIFKPQSLPKFVYDLADGIILININENKSVLKYFLKLGIPPRKLICWQPNQGWATFKLPAEDGSSIFYLCGLEFHIRNEDDENFFKKIYDYLQNQWRTKNLDPKHYPEVLSKIFQYITQSSFDLNNVQTFTEKIKWIKIYDATQIKSRLADKYAVRSWVAEKIGAEYLIPLLGVWDNFDDIDFDLMPNQFVLKCNHASSMNIIVRDKNSFDKQRAREKINAWLALDFSSLYFEFHYTRIKRKIIAEEFIKDDYASDVNDYKFWCLDGQVKYIQVDRNRSTNHVQRFYSTNWEPLSFIIVNHTLDDKILEKPARIEEMINIAEQLSAEFNFVRVDLYCVNEKIYFGEMTFTPLAGNFSFNPKDIDEYLGSLLKLPEPTSPPKL